MKASIGAPLNTFLYFFVDQLTNLHQGIINIRFYVYVYFQLKLSSVW